MSKKNKTPLQRYAHKIARRDGGWFCHYCWCRIHMYPELLEKYPNSRQATLDHIVSVHAGGGTSLPNLVLACLQCNRQKGTRDYNEFYAETAHYRKAPRAEHRWTRSGIKKSKNSHYKARR